MAERTNHPLLMWVPADRTVLQLRKTDTRNGGTSTALFVMGPHTQRGCAWELVVDTRSRRQPQDRAGTMAREANARGKAAGYADAGPVVNRVGAAVGVQMS
jgi:hypothetical protein